MGLAPGIADLVEDRQGVLHVLAAGGRAPQLDLRPAHGDEGRGFAPAVSQGAVQGEGLGPGLKRLVPFLELGMSEAEVVQGDRLTTPVRGLAAQLEGLAEHRPSPARLGMQSE